MRRFDIRGVGTDDWNLGGVIPRSWLSEADVIEAEDSKGVYRDAPTSDIIRILVRWTDDAGKVHHHWVYRADYTKSGDWGDIDFDEVKADLEHHYYVSVMAPT